jgi:hypothetical protein
MMSKFNNQKPDTEGPIMFLNAFEPNSNGELVRIAPKSQWLGSLCIYDEGVHKDTTADMDKIREEYFIEVTDEELILNEDMILGPFYLLPNPNYDNPKLSKYRPAKSGSKGVSFANPGEFTIVK